MIYVVLPKDVYPEGVNPAMGKPETYLGFSA